MNDTRKRFTIVSFFAAAVIVVQIFAANNSFHLSAKNNNETTPGSSGDFRNVSLTSSDSVQKTDLHLEEREDAIGSKSFH